MENNEVQAQSHHIHYPRWYNIKELMKAVEEEAMRDIEPGQNVWVFPLWYPVNTNK